MNICKNLTISAMIMSSLSPLTYSEPLKAGVLTGPSKQLPSRPFVPGMQDSRVFPHTELAPRGQQGPSTEIPGFSSNRNADRRLGNQQRPNDGWNWSSPDGFDNPLAGKSGTRPRSTVVTPGSIPRQGFDRQNSNGGTESIPFEDGGKMVIHTNPDGSQYRETYGGDGQLETFSTVEPGEDGNTIRTTVPEPGGGTGIREEHFDADGNPLYDTYTSVRPTNPSPRYQPDDTSGGGTNGWYNPITGQSSCGYGLRVNNNQVRPGAEQPGAATPSVAPTGHELVINPNPEVYHGNDAPRVIDRNGGKIINPGGR